MNKDHQSDRQTINLTIPPIFNPQGKSTSIGAIAEGFLSMTKATYSEIYRRYIRRVDTYIEENYQTIRYQILSVHEHNNGAALPRQLRS